MAVILFQLRLSTVEYRGFTLKVGFHTKTCYHLSGITFASVFRQGADVKDQSIISFIGQQNSSNTYRSSVLSRNLEKFCAAPLGKQHPCGVFIAAHPFKHFWFCAGKDVVDGKQAGAFLNAVFLHRFGQAGADHPWKRDTLIWMGQFTGRGRETLLILCNHLTVGDQFGFWRLHGQKGVQFLPALFGMWFSDNMEGLSQTAQDVLCIFVLGIGSPHPDVTVLPISIVNISTFRLECREDGCPVPRIFFTEPDESRLIFDGGKTDHSFPSLYSRVI